LVKRSRRISPPLAKDGDKLWYLKRGGEWDFFPLLLLLVVEEHASSGHNRIAPPQNMRFVAGMPFPLLSLGVFSPLLDE